MVIFHSYVSLPEGTYTIHIKKMVYLVMMITQKRNASIPQYLHGLRNPWEIDPQPSTLIPRSSIPCSHHTSPEVPESTSRYR